LPLELQVSGYYLLSEGRVLLTRGGGGKVAIIRRSYETARCRVFRWGLGRGQKNAMTFLKILYHHIQKIGRGGATTKVSLTRKLYEIARCRCVGAEVNIKRPFFLSFFLSFYLFLVDTNGKSIAVKRIQFTQGKRVAPTPETHKSNQWKSNHGG